MLQRKSLRLPNYDYGQSGAYFVTICTKEKRPVLSSIVGAADLCGPRSHLTAWGTVVEKYLRGIPGIEQYVIMPNHLHMIVFIRQTLGGPQGSAAPTNDLSMRIKAFKSLVTKALGFPIFQRSYYDHVIRCEEDYLRIAEYIQNNPVKWMEDTYYVARS